MLLTQSKKKPAVHTKTEHSTHGAVKTPKAEITDHAMKTQGKEYKEWKWGGGD